MINEYRPRLNKEVRPVIEWLKTLPENEQIKRLKNVKSNIAIEMLKGRDWCYLIRCIDLYKIGRASDLGKRFKRIRSMNPYAELVCASQKVDEAYLHLLYADYRQEGEWFKLSLDQVLAVKGMMG